MLSEVEASASPHKSPDARNVSGDFFYLKENVLVLHQQFKKLMS
jgi:hypothetical protein